MNNITIFFLFIFFNTFSQESFIQKNDGSRVTIQYNSVKVVAVEKQILYKILDGESEKTLDFKEFQSIVYGPYKFVTIKLNGSKNLDGFFEIANLNDKKLVCIQIVDLDSESNALKFVFHVLDKDNFVIESHTITDQINAKQANYRSEIYSKIKNYFPDCTRLIQRINSFDNKDNDANNLSILNFFKKPIFVSCP